MSPINTNQVESGRSKRVYQNNLRLIKHDMSFSIVEEKLKRPSYLRPSCRLNNVTQKRLFHSILEALGSHACVQKKMELPPPPPRLHLSAVHSSLTYNCMECFTEDPTPGKLVNGELLRQFMHAITNSASSLHPGKGWLNLSSDAQLNV